MSSPVRVCHVITRMILGGAQEDTLLILQGLKEHPEFEPFLLSGPPTGPEGELLRATREAGIETRVIDSLRRDIHPLRDLQSLRAMVRFFTEHPFDIVHTSSSKAGILGRWAAHWAGVPWIAHTIHGLPFHRYVPFLRNKLYRTLEAGTSTVTHAVRAVCETMKRRARAAGVEPSGSFETLYTGMRLENFLEVEAPDEPGALKAREQWDLPRETFVVGKIARLFPLKGHKFILRAFKEFLSGYSDAMLFLVGDGILRGDLESLAEELGIRERVRFAGLLPRGRVPRALAAMDILVHSSLWEGLPRVLPQALAAGRPAISYDVAGAPEIIRHGRNGYLLPLESVGELAGAMLELARDRALRREMGRAGREDVYPRFHWRYLVRTLIEMYGRQMQRDFKEFPLEAKP